MDVKEIKSEGLSREIQIRVPANDIDKHIENHLRNVGKTVKLPGFRPGKVPLDVLKKRYGRAVMGEVLEKIVGETSMKALTDKGLKPALQPDIEVEEFDEGKDLTYKMKLEILPEFEVMDVKALKLEKPVVEISDEAVDKMLAQLAERNRDSQKIEQDRAAEKGDIVRIDFHGKTTDDNKEHPGMHGHGHMLELGSGQFIPGFEEQLIGKKAGESVTVTVTFPENYQAAELAGREAEFAVDLEEIHEPGEGKIDDDLAKKLGLEDLEALKTAIRQQLTAQNDHLSRMKLKRQLLDKLDEKHVFEVPAKMEKLEYENMCKQVEQEQKVKADSFSDDEKQELEEIANRRVRLGLVLAQIGNASGITVNDQELQQAVIREAQRYQGQEKQVFDFYQKNKNALESLRAPVFEDKVVDHILGQADVAEKKVTQEELEADDEDETGGATAAAKGKSAGKKGSKTKKPDSDKTKAAKPKAAKPKSDKPKSDKPKSEKPKSEKPKSEKPKTDQGKKAAKA